MKVHPSVLHNGSEAFRSGVQKLHCPPAIWGWQFTFVIVTLAENVNVQRVYTTQQTAK